MEEQFSDNSSNYFPSECEEITIAQKRQRFSRPKVCDSSFWSNENIKKLITTIRAHPAIWQADSEGFKSRVQREAAWQKVSEAFGYEIIDLNQLVAKWQNLRTQYRSVRAAARKYATQQIGKKPAWRFYNQMAFIDNVEGNESKDVNEASSPEQILKLKQSQLRKVIDSSIWNDKNVIKLINAVKKRKSIWNFNDENYKLRGIRESDWHSINDEFNNEIPVNQLAAKWQNLRTSYRSAKKLKKEHALQRTPHWKYYSYMTFLEEEEQETAPIEEMQEIEELEEIESIEPSEDVLNLNEPSNEALNHNDLEEIDTEKTTNDLQQKPEIDSIDVFGNFFVCQLRKIKNEAYLEATQRKVLQFLWQCIDEEPVNSDN